MHLELQVLLDENKQHTRNILRCPRTKLSSATQSPKSQGEKQGRTWIGNIVNGRFEVCFCILMFFCIILEEVTFASKLIKHLSWNRLEFTVIVCWMIYTTT